MEDTLMPFSGYDTPLVGEESGKSGPSAKKPSQMPKRLRRFHGGWRTGVFVGMVTAFAVLLLNISTFIWVFASFELSSGTATIYEGPCDRTMKTSTWSHLAINIISTLLLSANNVGMQCLSSPTRKEIDKVHLKGGWLNVGVPNARNLGSIHPLRTTLWVLLALSSVPLHFL